MRVTSVVHPFFFFLYLDRGKRMQTATNNMSKHWQQQAQALSREARGGEKHRHVENKEKDNDQRSTDFFSLCDSDVNLHITCSAYFDWQWQTRSNTCFKVTWADNFQCYDTRELDMDHPCNQHCQGNTPHIRLFVFALFSSDLSFGPFLALHSPSSSAKSDPKVGYISILILTQVLEKLQKLQQTVCSLLWSNVPLGSFFIHQSIYIPVSVQQSDNK